MAKTYLTSYYKLTIILKHKIDIKLAKIIYSPLPAIIIHLL